jgi:hypothetical protein
VGEEDVISLSDGIDTHVKFSVGGMRKEWFDDEVGQSADCLFDLRSNETVNIQDLFNLF